MKITLTIITLFFSINFMVGQNSIVSSKQLSQQEINSIFTDSLKNKLQIEYSIYRVYKYNDKEGKHFIIMTQNKINCKEKRDCHDSIRAYCFSFKNEVFNLKWTFKDFILPNSYEYSISHWTKYFQIDDYNKDGIADPIIIYGTFGMNETYDGRIKILIYYKNNKKAIRHQNGVLDYERNTQVDKEFYELPIVIQNQVKVIMENIIKNNHGIFPYNWKNDMKNKKLKFDEN
ncbi:M949_RS01915 family surface polysaccharide biosynthesis protein [Tenacibaculum sp.]|uniref:M949_RS01915 family surface polysaccharide biosynthesis protein n=1 Tax=Tenacibaculum sp. TaxID=1906242 RepID=UPI003AA868AC